MSPSTYLRHLLLIPLQLGMGGIAIAMVLVLGLILSVAIVAHLHVVLTILAALWVVAGALIFRHDRRARAPVRWALLFLPVTVAGAAAPVRALVVIPGELGHRAELLKGHDRRTRQEGPPLVRIEPAEPFGYRWFADAATALSGVVVATATAWIVLRRLAVRPGKVWVRDLAEGVFEVEGTVVDPVPGAVADGPPVVRATRTVRLQGRESQLSTEHASREFLIDDGTGGILLVDPRAATLAPPVGVELIASGPKLFLSRRASWTPLQVGVGWRVERTVLPGDRVRLIARFERHGSEWLARAVPPPSFPERLAGGAPLFLLTDGSRFRLHLALRGPLVRASFAFLVWLTASSVSAGLLLSRLSHRFWLPEQIATFAPVERRTDLLLEALERSGDAPSVALLDALRTCRFGPGEVRLEPRLLALSAHPEPRVRAFVARALAALGRSDERALAAFRIALSDRDEAVRTAAVSALEALGPAGLAVAEDALRRAALPEGRADAVTVLGKLLDRGERSRRLRELLAADVPAVRRAAATLLRHGDPEDVAALLRAVDDPDASVGDAAFLALPEPAATGLALGTLGRRLASADHATWSRAARILASRPAASVEPLFLGELASGDETRARRALSELEQRKTPLSAAAATVLGRLAVEGPPALRYATLTQLERMGPDGAAAVPELARWLPALAPGDALRARVLALLGKLGARAAGAIPALEGLFAREPLSDDVLATLLRARTPLREADVRSKLGESPVLSFDGATFRASRAALPRGAEGPFRSSPGLGGPAMALAPVSLEWESPVALGWDFAFELWFRVDAGASVRVLDSNLVALRVDRGVARVQWRDRTTGELVSSDPLEKEGWQLAPTWHHVALVRDGERRALDAYLDGALAVSVPDLRVVHYTAPEERLVVSELGNELRSLELGGSDEEGSSVRGALQSLAIHDHLLTAEQVAAHAQLDAERSR